MTTQTDGLAEKLSREEAGETRSPGGRRRGPRPVIFVLWGIVTVALLCEYLFTLNDLARADASRRAMSLAVEDAESELLGEPGSESDEAVMKLTQELQALRKDKLELLQSKSDMLTELERLRNQPSERSTASVGVARASENAARTLVDFQSRPRALPQSGRPHLRGKILSTQEETGFVAIDLGERDGIHPGMRLRVFARDLEVGTLQVLEVRESVAGGRITLMGGRTATEGLEVGQ